MAVPPIPLAPYVIADDTGETHVIIDDVYDDAKDSSVMKMWLFYILCDNECNVTKARWEEECKKAVTIDDPACIAAYSAYYDAHVALENSNTEIDAYQKSRREDVDAFRGALLSRRTDGQY